MVLATIYFQMHQPFRLHPDRDRFLWDEKNKEISSQEAETIYLPTIDSLIGLIQRNEKIRFAWGMSGTFLEQAEQFNPTVLDKIKELFEKAGERFELLDETYYDSFAALFADSNKREHKEQVSMQRTKIRELFGIDPLVVRYPERMFNNDIANLVADMGLNVMIADIPRNENDVLYLAKDTNVVVIPRDIVLSRVSPEELGKIPSAYVDMITKNHVGSVCLGFPLERIGTENCRNYYIEFLEALANHPNFEMKTPSELASVNSKQLPALDVPGFSTKTWQTHKDAEKDTNGLIRNEAQLDYMKRVESLEKIAREVGSHFLINWRCLTSIDNLKFLQESFEGNPYGSAIDAAYTLSQKLSAFDYSLDHRFQIIKERQTPTVMHVTGEPGDLPESMGPLASYVKACVGGVGILIPSLIQGIQDMGWKVVIAGPNLKRRFQTKAGMTDEEREALRYNTDPENIELVSDDAYANLWSTYEGDQEVNAGAFQLKVANEVLVRRKAQAKGPFIVHAHDAMGSGLVVAKANARNIPVVTSVHGSHEILIPMWRFGDLEQRVSNNLYVTSNNEVASLTTGIKACWIPIMVSPGWLGDHLLGNHPDVIYPPIRIEVIEKYKTGAVECIINCPHPDKYPENSKYLKNPKEFYTPEAAALIKPFGPNSNLIEVKRNFLKAFQIEMGLRQDPNAILLLYSARADRFQKSVHWVEEKAQPLVNYFADRGKSVQIAFLSEGVGKDYAQKKGEEDILTTIALQSNGGIAFKLFGHQWDALGNGAANIGIGPSMFEPCGQNDIMAWLYGAIFLGTDTGGYHDKIENLRLTMLGATQDHGNGLKFKYDKNEFWNKMVWGVQTIDMMRQTPEYYASNMKRIMEKTRVDYSIDKMIAADLAVYERCLRSMQR